MLSGIEVTKAALDDFAKVQRRMLLAKEEKPLLNGQRLGTPFFLNIGLNSSHLTDDGKRHVYAFTSFGDF